MTLKDSLSAEFDPEYYWDFTTFLVQNRVFRVPNVKLREGSKEFAERLVSDKIFVDDHVDNDNEKRCRSCHEPVRLDVTIEEFRSFLTVLYPLTDNCHALPKERWLSVLKLASEWGFSDLRDRAIQELGSLQMSPGERVRSACQFQIRAWVVSGVEELIHQDEPVSIDDAQILGIANALQLCAIRERRMQGSLSTAVVTDLVNTLAPWNVPAETPLHTHEEAIAPSSEDVGVHEELERAKKTHSSPPSIVATPTKSSDVDGSPLPPPSPSRHRLSWRDCQRFPGIAETGDAPFVDMNPKLKIFLGSAYFEDGLHPCKVQLGHDSKRWTAFVPFGGKEHRHHGHINILPLLADQMEWVQASRGLIPPGRRAIEGGYEKKGNTFPLYHALAHVGGIKVPGKAGKHLGGCLVPFDGRAIAFPDSYKILCWKD